MPKLKSPSCRQDNVSRKKIYRSHIYAQSFAPRSHWALSPVQQTSTISDLLRHEKRTNATEKQQDEIIDHTDNIENPLIQAMPNKRVEKALQKRPSEVALLQTRQCFQKNIDLTTNTQMLGSERFFNRHLITPNAKEIQEFPQEKFFYYPNPRAKDPLQMRSSLL